jgi:uncharacterized tellurite resistance protein B-like protein
MTTQTATSDLLFPEATPLFGDLTAKLEKGWKAYGLRLAIAAISLCLSLMMADGVVLSLTGSSSLV